MRFSVSRRRRGLGAKRLGHRGVGEPLVADADEIALLRGEALMLEQGLRDIARLGGEALRAPRLRHPRQGRPTPWRANSGSTNSISISSAPLRLAKPATAPSITASRVNAWAKFAPKACSSSARAPQDSRCSSL